MGCLAFFSVLQIMLPIENTLYVPTLVKDALEELRECTTNPQRFPDYCKKAIQCEPQLQILQERGKAEILKERGKNAFQLSRLDDYGRKNVLYWKGAIDYFRILLCPARCTLQACFILAGSVLAGVALVEVLQALNGNGAVQADQEQMKMAAMTTALMARDTLVDKALGAAQSRSNNSVVANVSSFVHGVEGGGFANEKALNLAKDYAKAVKGVNPKHVSGIDVIAVLFLFYGLFYIISAIFVIASINTEFDKHGSLLMSIHEACQEATCSGDDELELDAEEHLRFIERSISTIKDKAQSFPLTILSLKVSWGMLYSYLITAAFVSIQYLREAAIHYVTEACSDVGARADTLLTNSSYASALGISVNASAMIFEMACLPLQAQIGSRTAQLSSFVNTSITGMQ